MNPTGWRRRIWNAIEGPELASDGAPLGERLLPLLFAVVPSGVLLALLRPEIADTAPVNDMAAHKLWVRWAAERIRDGHVPLDGWITNLSFGVPHFHYYQSRPHVIAALIEVVTGVQNMVGWSVYLLLAAFPLSIYAAFCRLGWGRWAAATGALFASFMNSADGHGLEIQSYVWRGRGVWTQLWASIALPWAIVLGWRSLVDGRRYLVAVFAISLTVWFHLIQAYFLFILMPFWLLANPSKIRVRLPRLIKLVIGVGLTSLWTLGPTLLDQSYVGQTEFNVGTFYKDSYGLQKVLGWLVSGEIMDAGRFPWITLFAFLGFGVALKYGWPWLPRWFARAVARARNPRLPRVAVAGGSPVESDPHAETYRMAVIVTAVGLCLWFGPEFWGPSAGWLPGGDAMIFHRFVLAAQMGLLLLAAAGGGRLAEFLKASAARGWPTAPKATISVAMVVVLGLAAFPGLRDTRTYLNQNRIWIEEQSAADNVRSSSTDGAAVAALLEAAHARGPGRVYAGLMNTWGPQNRVAQAPLYSWVLRANADVIGFNIRTQSLTTDSEPRFDDTDPAHFNLFNVRYWLSDASVGSPSEALHAKWLASSGRFTLWEVPTTGWMDAIDLSGKVITTTALDLGQASIGFLKGAGPASKLYPQVDLGAGVKARPTSVEVEPLTATFSKQAAEGTAGKFRANVEMSRDAYVVLKESYHPWWRAEVDGRAVDTVMVAPGFIAVPVSKGVHSVSFEYQPFAWYLPLMVLAAFAFMWLAGVFEPLERRLRSRLVRVRPAWMAGRSERAGNASADGAEIPVAASSPSPATLDPPAEVSIGEERS